LLTLKGANYRRGESEGGDGTGLHTGFRGLIMAPDLGDVHGGALGDVVLLPDPLVPEMLVEVVHRFGRGDC
jgi:hypothetical protein